MGQALTEQLSMFPAETFQEILSLTGGIDEIKGWWQAYSRSASHLLVSLRHGAGAATIAAIQENLTVPGPVLERVPRQEPREPDFAETVPACLGLVESVLEDWADLSLGEELILEFHGKLSGTAGGGAYRTRQPGEAPQRRRSLESIALDPVSPDRVAQEVEALTDWTTQQLAHRSSHPLLVIASFLLEFLAIHPFNWGNHRMARILANLLLMQAGYSYMPYTSLERAIADRRTYYDIALRNAIVNRKMPRPDISPWFTEFLLVLRNQAVWLRAATEGYPHIDLLSENQMRVMGLFAVHREITVRLIAHELQLSRDTAKQVLSRLHSLGLVHRFGSGRAVRYGPVR